MSQSFSSKEVCHPHKQYYHFSRAKLKVSFVAGSQYVLPNTGYINDLASQRAMMGSIAAMARTGGSSVWIEYRARLETSVQYGPLSMFWSGRR